MNKLIINIKRSCEDVNRQIPTAKFDFLIDLKPYVLVVFGI